MLIQSRGYYYHHSSSTRLPALYRFPYRNIFPLSVLVSNWLILFPIINEVQSVLFISSRLTFRVLDGLL